MKNVEKKFIKARPIGLVGQFLLGSILIQPHAEALSTPTRIAPTDVRNSRLVISATNTNGAEQGFSADQLLNLIESKKLKSIEETITQLPAHLRRNSTFIYESRNSLQEASPIYPRALLWDERSGFVLAFNGHKDQAGFENFEMVEFDFDKLIFRYKEITFTENQNTNGDWDGTTPKAVLSEPRSCFACHGANPRPIWAEYPNWPGTYGSTDDFMRGQELEQFRAFRHEAAKQPRYLPLFTNLDLLPRNPDSPISSEGILRETYPYRPEFDASPHAVSGAFLNRPNLRLGVLMNRLNSLRITQTIAKTIESRPGYLNTHSRENVLYHWLGCSEDFAVSTVHYQAVLAEAGLAIEDIDIRANTLEPQYDWSKWEDSYYDGSATTTELVGWQLLQRWSDIPELKTELPRLQSSRLPELFNFSNKRLFMDGEFFSLMDKLSLWVKVPFPSEMTKTKLRIWPKIWQNRGYSEICKSLSPYQ